MPAPRLLKVGVVVNPMAVDSSESIDGPPDACGFTVDSMLVHDCLLDTWGGLEIDPAAFDAAHHANRTLMGPGYCAPDGSILR